MLLENTKSLSKNNSGEKPELHTECLYKFYLGRAVCQVCSEKSVMNEKLLETLQKLQKIVLLEAFLLSKEGTIHIDCLDQFITNGTSCISCRPQIIYLKQKLSSYELKKTNRKETNENFFRAVGFVSIIAIALLWAPYYEP